MQKNVLISTTRQWNPGDEFIMQGSQNILKKVYGDIFNPIIFNRNPDVRNGCFYRNSTRCFAKTNKWDHIYFKGKGIVQEVLRIGHYDNSYKDDMNGANIDLAVFAGSPEWYGNRLRPMYKAIKEYNIPTVLLGLGVGDSTSFHNAVSDVDYVLKKAKLITTRDRQTEELLKDYGAIYVPCPALLAADFSREVTNVKKVGLIYATNNTVYGNNVSDKMHAYILDLYKAISEHYEVGLICHYIDEIDQAKEEFPGWDIHYSYDSKDYQQIYNRFDFVVGGRVHGIGLSASLGIPGLMVRHDSRSSTTDGFLAPYIEVDTPIDMALNKIEEMINDIQSYSARLLTHKEAVLERYVTLLKETDLSFM